MQSGVEEILDNQQEPTNKVEAKFIASLTDLELVQDVFKAYNVNFV